MAAGAVVDAWAVRFEATVPARWCTARKGQRHLPGRWWSATDAGHVVTSRGWNGISSQVCLHPGGRMASYCMPFT